MTPYQYNLYAQGCAFREQVQQLPFRRIYHKLHNSNSKRPISFTELKQYWPLPDIDKTHVDTDEMDEMRERMKSLREANEARKQRQEELKKRQDAAS